MDKCSSPGDALNNWTSGCEHLGSSSNKRNVTTVSAGGNSDWLWDSGPVVPTSRGLATRTSSDNEQIFGSGGTLGGRSSSSTSTVGSSGGINPSTGYADSYTDKLNDWAPSGSSSGSTLGPAKITFDESSVKKIDKEVGTKTDVTSDSPESLMPNKSGTQAAEAAPPAPPSTRPYVWKYQ